MGPLVEPCSLTITNVYVDDPWYARSGGAHSPGDGGCSAYPCGNINLKPNRMIDYTTWKTFYYTPWTHQDCAHWNNLWVSVLRKDATSPPSLAAAMPNPADVVAGKDPSMAPTTDWTMGPNPAEPAAPQQVFSASASVSDVDAAFGRVVRDRALASKKDIGELVGGGHVTHVVRVTSLVTTFPDYLLATVVGKHGARSVAMFTLDGGQPAFAGLTTSDTAMNSYPFVSGAEAERAVRAAGLKTRGTPKLVWGWSSETESPYYPLYQVDTMSGTRFVDQFGVVTESVNLEAPAR